MIAWMPRILIKTFIIARYCFSFPWCFGVSLRVLNDQMGMDMDSILPNSFDCMRAWIPPPRSPTTIVFRAGTNNLWKQLLRKCESHAPLWTCMLDTFYLNVLFITFSSILVVIKGIRWHYFHFSSHKRKSNKASLNGSHTYNPSSLNKLTLYKLTLSADKNINGLRLCSNMNGVQPPWGESKDDTSIKHSRDPIPMYKQPQSTLVGETR